MWNIRTEYLNSRQMKKYEKQHRDEYASCMSRLGYLQGLLDDGTQIHELPYSLLHNEKQGLFAVGNARKPSSRETRLYFYFYFVDTEIYLLGIGDKDSQQRDILAHRKTIEQIRNDMKRSAGHASSKNE